MGTARIPTHGSWRPFVTISISLPSTSMVFPGTEILDVGLRAMCTTRSWPLEMPPSTPPAWLLLKPSGVSVSRCSLPFCSITPKPSPISTPFTALMPIMALAMSASRRSKTGSPNPTGIPVATTETFAPIESPDFFRSRMYWSNSSSLLSSGQKNGLVFVTL